MGVIGGTVSSMNEVLFIHAKCHVSAGLTVKWEPMGKKMVISCYECNAFVVEYTEEAFREWEEPG